ncbi:MAG: tetratricopeptide repeat protein [Akkermansia sp.]|nr:tetratricopeptide repeat protein [Akkermansia sp.]
MNHAPLITSKSTMMLAAIALTCPFAYAQAGTAGYLSTSSAAGTSEVGPTAVYSGTQQSINMRETARRQAMQHEAQQLLQEGRDAYKAGKYSIALEKFKAAWNRIPKAPATQVLQEHIVDVIGDASIAVAGEYAKVGRYDDAEQLLLDVLSRNPNNERARRDLSMLRDPVRNNPALTPQHVRDVEEVNRLLTLGYGYYDLGKYDEAYSTFAQVIKIDPYNKAARAGQEAVSKRRINYYESARNAFRAKALAEVDALWEEHQPQDLPDIEMGGGEVATAISERQIANDQNLSKMQITSVNFEDTPIEDALDFLRGEARKNGIQINFVFERPRNTPAPAAAAAEVDEEGEEAAEPVAATQTVQEAVVPGLKVQGVTAKELLQMICAQAGCQYRVEDTGIVVYQTGAGVERMFKRKWKVARDFFEGGSDDGGEDDEDEDDGFTDDSGSSKRGGRIDAVAALRAAGVSFPKGASAQYSTRTGMLTVENTADNLDAVEEAVNEHRRQMPQMIKVSAKFVEVSQTNEEELSFDWVVNPFSVSNNGSTYLGGVNGNSSDPLRTMKDFVTSGGTAFTNYHNNNGSWPIYNNGNLTDASTPLSNGLMTGGLRSGTGALTGSSMDSLVASGSAAANTSRSAAPGILSLSGIYNEGSFQMIMRGLSQKKGVDIMSAPSLVARPGELEYTPEPDPLASDQGGDNGCAKIEVIRRFIYPSAYDAPELGGANNNFNNNNKNNNNNNTSMPIASPANPSEWAVEEVGIVMRFKVDELEGNDIIKFNHFEIKVVNFEGFVNYGSPITAGIANEREIEHITLTENRIDMPIFSRRYINSNPCIYDGHTIAIGGMIEDNVQKVEDKVPVFGDLPLIGRFFRSNAESHVRKNLMIFVTAEKIDPTGKPTRLRDVGTGDNPTAGTSTPSLFPDDGLANP